MCIFCLRDETESWDVIKKPDERYGTERTLDSVDSVRVNQHHINLVHMGGGLRAPAIFLNYFLRRAEGAMPSIRSFPLFAGEQTVRGRRGVGVLLRFFPDCWRFRTKLCAHILFQLHTLCQQISPKRFRM